MPSEPLPLIVLDDGWTFEDAGGGEPDYLAFPADDPDTAARMAGPELRDVVAAVEWSRHGADYRHCPSCLGVDPSDAWAVRNHVTTGHRDGCALAAALSRARGEVEHGE